MEAELTLGGKKERNRRERRALNGLGLPSFKETLAEKNANPAVREAVQTVTLNIGLTCNQACTHCHVESSPKATETMSSEVAQRVLTVLKNSPGVKTLDITGGAPEMHAQFKTLVEGASALGLRVQDRCNLTVLLEPGHEGLVDFLAQHRVIIVASLPCYSAENVKKQRGVGVFERSIAAIKLLNEAGYGMEGSDLELNLVYNPAGAFLPPAQEMLQSAYQERLREDFGLEFNNLFTMTNMPIKRYVDVLKKEKKLETYCNMLVENFNPVAANATMCRNTVSLRWDGALFDCDFNLALETSKPGKKDISEIESFEEVIGDPIEVGHHCFGCSAGAGSS